MGLFDNCILACDIDGTLMENGYINSKNIEKIDFFMNEGGKFSLSTGRAVVAVGDVLSSIKRLSPSVMANGSIVYDFENGNALFEKVLPENDYRIAELVYSCGIDVGIEIHCKDKAFTLRRTDETDLHQLYEHFIAREISFEEACKYKWNKVNYIFNSAKDRETVKQLIAKENVNCNFVDTCAMIDGKLRNYHEQIPFGVSKASALSELCNLMQIKKGGLFAIGDYYNDLEMLKMADISAVPIDSPEDIKEKADYITVACLSGAVADFIDYLTGKFNAANSCI